jgi:hypothetical protein
VPEFILDKGSPAASKAFTELPSFVQGYIEAMFFTDTGYAENGDLEHATVEELAPEFKDRIEADCAAFVQQADALLRKACAEHPYEMVQAGRDFWFTRCGHGVGFWDRGLGDVGDKLSDACKQFGNVDIYRGDDGLIYGD